MENYTVNTKLGIIKIPILLSTDVDDLLKEQRKDTIVNQLLNSETQQINDYEVDAFKYIHTSLNFDLYFYRECDLLVIDPPPRGQTAEYLEEYSCRGSEYVQHMLTHFGYADTRNFPLFYNTFLHPFHNRQNDWYVNGMYDQNRFEQHSYLYNSFLKMNFYTTPFSATQELLFENVVYVTPRWCKKEGDRNGTWLRPTFQLNKNTDGYYLYWLKKFNLNQDSNTDVFYVNFQFWNAAVGTSISFIPTVANTLNNFSNKRWVQSTNFDYKTMYLRCTINYIDKTYFYQEYDQNTGDWSKSVDSLWLYELIFDNENKFVNANLNYYLANDECPIEIPPILPSDFGVQVVPINDLVFKFAPLQLVYGSDTVVGNEVSISDFWGIRAAIEDYAYNLTPEGLNGRIPTEHDYMKKVTINNTGTSLFYLKDINITVTSDTLNGRLVQMSKKYHKDETGQIYTTYICATIPNAEFSPQIGNTVTGDFDDYYYLEDTEYNTTATQRDKDAYKAGDDSKRYATSAERYYSSEFPLSLNNFWDTKYSELLFITRKGTDLTPINVGGSLELYIRWGFDIKGVTYDSIINSRYIYTFWEPLFYGFLQRQEIWLRGTSTTPKSICGISLDYNVILHFNDMDNTFPDDQNNYPLSGKVDVNKLSITQVGITYSNKSTSQR